MMTTSVIPIVSPATGVFVVTGGPSFCIINRLCCIRVCAVGFPGR
jgi:hypothetical protein